MKWLSKTRRCECEAHLYVNCLSCASEMERRRRRGWPRTLIGQLRRRRTWLVEWRLSHTHTHEAAAFIYYTTNTTVELANSKHKQALIDIETHWGIKNDLLAVRHLRHRHGAHAPELARSTSGINCLIVMTQIHQRQRHVKPFIENSREFNFTILTRGQLGVCAYLPPICHLSPHTRVFLQSPHWYHHYHFHSFWETSETHC